MRINNRTEYRPEALIREMSRGFDTSSLRLRVRANRRTRMARGTCWAWGGILISINPNNPYPCLWKFRTSEYIVTRFEPGFLPTRHVRRQTVQFRSPEHLIAGIFAHELKHYLDFRAGAIPRRAEVKADEFALGMVEGLGIGQMLADPPTPDVVERLVS